MEAELTRKLVEEHRLILRMIDLLERNARATAEGKYENWQFYLDGVEFIREFADRFHHAKEEHVLFEALIKSGMPAEHSPVAVMLMEHEEGRSFVRALEQATREALAGMPGREQDIAENALAFAKLLRDHIGKEDGILYPLAERFIPEGTRSEVLEGYRRAEAGADPEIIERYRA
ncbi:MAG TPA: hemerythrin domain-containing protein, partial [Geobacteraceae bacterium]